MKTTLEDRFWAKVDKNGPVPAHMPHLGQCWVWTACRGTGRNGEKLYGFIGVNGTNKLSHRVSWELHNGTIPDGMCVMHKCDNMACVNPDHLQLGTLDDNNKDMATKKRSATGDRHGSRTHPGNHAGTKNAAAKLTEADALEIVRLHETGNYTLRELGSMFGVSTYPIYGVIHGLYWSHVTGIEPHLDGVAHGETHGNAKLTEEDVRRVVALLDSGMRQCDVARELGMRHDAVTRIANGKACRHITRKAG